MVCVLLGAWARGAGTAQPPEGKRSHMRGTGRVRVASAKVRCGDTLNAAGKTGRGDTGPEGTGVGRGTGTGGSTLALRVRSGRCMLT